MKRLLFVTDTFFPDSSATTTLVMRTAQKLMQQGYSVDVCPSEISGNHFIYPAVYNGVRVVSPDDVAREECFVPVKASEDHPFTSRHVENLVGVLASGNYDCVFSAAVAFEVNFLVHEVISDLVLRQDHDKPSIIPKWYPMAYDPYAFDPHLTQERRRGRAAREIDALKDATKIFFLTEFKNDYIGSPIEDKIEWFMLPCIRPIMHSASVENRSESAADGSAIRFDPLYINCVFLGDFYYGEENTDFIFRLFEALGSNIRLYTIGNLCDFKPTVDLWKEKLGGRYICHERIRQDKAQDVMLDCDVLVSMGHDSANMCPSKIIDFISSGKPILHIKKIEDCCGAKYLQRYPNKFFIYQNDELTKAKISALERFIVSAKGAKPMPFNEVKVLYGDFTMEVLIEKIEKEIKKK